MRTTTQRTNLPFLIAESGAASFTLAVITSPRPARSPRSPPRGRMHCSLRAPLLSATSRIVRIPIMTSSPYPSKNVVVPSAASVPRNTLLVLRLRSLRRRLQTGIEQILRLHANLNRAANYVAQSPALQLAERPVLHDPDHVADLGCA